MKHFPGDGYCKDDQHITTSINPLSKTMWNKTFKEVYKELINEGSNISSSPGKVSINVLDPAKAAIMVACTSVVEYVDMKRVINLTSNKQKGMGGIETKGFARKIY